MKKLVTTVVLSTTLASAPLLARGEKENAHEKGNADEDRRDAGRWHDDGQDERDARQNGRDEKRNGRHMKGQGMMKGEDIKEMGGT